jgi:hypothetical protein
MKISAALVLLLLTGCSDNGSDKAKAGGDPTDASTNVASGVGLRETCPRVEAAIRNVDIISPPVKMATAHGRVQALADAGDLETKNALRGVVEVIEEMQTAAQGQESVDAFSAWTAAVSNLADRCRAVGSSALQ